MDKKVKESKKQKGLWILSSLLICFSLIGIYLIFSSPSKVQITRPENSMNNLSALNQTITNKFSIMWLYYEINLLPAFPEGRMSCPKSNGTEYYLTFYQGETFMSAVVLYPTGCERVKLSTGEFKWALDRKLINYSKTVQNTLNLSDVEFYGSQNGRSFR